MTAINPKQVFGPRVDAYVKYRPGYPVEVRDTLIRECGLNPGWRVADIGSGSGLLARLFLDFGCRVTGIEPNPKMRQAGEQLLAGYPGFTSLPGTAEETGLAEACVELVSAGMAFHWFDARRAKEEFRRILTPAGWVALAWHRMLTGPEPFLQAYTGLVLECAPGWSETTRRDQPESSLNLKGFFNGAYRRAGFPTRQGLDWNGLYGRTLSIAHVPQPDDPAHAAMIAQLRDIFESHQKDGQVVIQYETELYYGQIQ